MTCDMLRPRNVGIALAVVAPVVFFVLQQRESLPSVASQHQPLVHLAPIIQKCETPAPTAPVVTAVAPANDAAVALHGMYAEGQSLNVVKTKTQPSVWMVVGSDAISQEILHQGTFATFIMNTLRFSIEKFSGNTAGQRCTVIDVGCNVGAVSIQAAGMGCKVHAFDVQQFAIALVKASVAINGFDAQVNQNAVSDVDGDQIPIFLRDGVNLGMTTIVKDLDALVKAPSGQVETIMLDTYAAANKIQAVDFLKIDVEGAEFGVVKGAEVLIREKRVKVVLCEVWYQHAVETLSFFNERGYRSFHMAATPTAENVWGAEILPAEFASFQASHSPPQYPAGDVVFVLSSLLH